ncbi:uncharacterized protein [Spinacia oleracea]|uniref:Uncharacterized protein isoform X1 n=1 Tax=Spinacia oleracea TaxID=3562 RepID=A0A9R0I8X8_SPIOL|nr:uncharacterized protein LOC110784667 isoform X1 [Spinacia oleracea]
MIFHYKGKSTTVESLSAANPRNFHRRKLSLKFGKLRGLSDKDGDDEYMPENEGSEDEIGYGNVKSKLQAFLQVRVTAENNGRSTSLQLPHFTEVVTKNIARKVHDQLNGAGRKNDLVIGTQFLVEDQADNLVFKLLSDLL